jgi:SAM-dependent methyltransferase
VNPALTNITRAIQKASKIAAATSHRPEAKLRELVSPLFKEYLKSKGLDLEFEQRDEVVLANGTPDSVYNRLILEYKKPGVIKADNAKNRVVIAKVQGYIEDLAEKEGWKKERLLGVAFDGGTFLFVRKARRWILQDPLPVTAESVEFFFQNLEKLLGRYPLIPEYLIRDFSVGDSPASVATAAIKAFYFALKSNLDPKVKAFFDQWKLQFAEVHGAIENKKFDADTLFRSYGFTKPEQKDFDFLAFFFALDTYYGLFMKLLAYQVVGHYTMGGMVGLPLSEWENLDSLALKETLKQLEDGGIFRQLGVRNFLEGDLLSWYLSDWNASIESSVRDIIKKLNRYDPQTMELLPDETRDILKKLYQFLVPKQIRHDLGEYYTPDWLAERCLNQVNYGPNERDLPNKRVLDPGCGSGTFLILAIKRTKEHARRKGIDPAETLNLITRNIVGFDLNPLAVISARTNYLLAIADLLKYKKGEVTIPVYLCDSINPPSAKEQSDLLDVEAGHFIVNTSVGPFRFPDVLVKKEYVQQVTELLEDAVRNKTPKDTFLTKVEQALGVPEGGRKKFELVLGQTYDKLIELERKGINGIWARIIKNAFAPLFVGKFDLIVGNPPWVNWESLPPQYREETWALWTKYGLFSLKGQEARLGGSKKDISMLMLYVSIDKYLLNEGKLSFVVTQTLFKTGGAGDGFRRFRVGQSGVCFKIEQVDDMVDLQPFEGATNKTAVVVCVSGRETKYPVPYTLWRRRDKGRLDIDLSFEEAIQATMRSKLTARPIAQSLTSPWLVTKPAISNAIKKVLGKSTYKARAGCCGWLNSVYLVHPIDLTSGLLRFNNYTANAKKEIEAVESTVEARSIFPTLQGREIRRWNAKPEIGIIIAQQPDRMSRGIPIEIMRRNLPKTLSYFSRFKSQLEGRSGYQKYLQGEPFYTLYNFGPHTLSTVKVVWTRVGNDLKSCVIEKSKSKLFLNEIVLPIETVVFVPFEAIEEAHYFCGMINSSISRLIISSYSNRGTGSFGSPHILQNVAIPKYDPQSETHKELTCLSKQCHEKATAGIDVSDLEEQIDQLAADLWGLSNEELKEIKESLEEMR